MDSNDSDSEDYEIKLESQVFTRLTEVVRAQYFKFLENQLGENWRTWQEQCDPLQPREKESIETSIHECAKFLEDLAIKEAVLTQLYQRAMIRTIGIVKESTKDKVLVEQLAPFLKSNVQKTASKATSTQILEYETKAIQTDDLANEPEKPPTLSLDERIDLFQTQLKKGQIDSECLKDPKPYVHIEKQSLKRRRHARPQLASSSSPASLIWHSPTPPPVVKCATNVLQSKTERDFDVQLEDDEIAQELEKLFTEQETDLNEIFGLVPHTQTNCEVTTSKVANETLHQRATINAPAISATTSNKMVTPKSNEQTFPPPVKDLRYSLWPCESFMQKRKLSATLNQLIEEDIRWHDILKWQFSVLFGDDEGSNDFAPCSPSIELDEVLQSSCMRRISPWVVRHLMKPLKDGLIGNRFLFKKLAKKLAHHIIMENQYPDESVIRTVIENYFCIHRAVMTSEDLNDIKMIPIDDYDE